MERPQGRQLVFSWAPSSNCMFNQPLPDCGISKQKPSQVFCFGGSGSRPFLPIDTLFTRLLYRQSKR